MCWGRCGEVRTFTCCWSKCTVHGQCEWQPADKSSKGQTQSYYMTQQFHCQVYNQETADTNALNIYKNLYMDVHRSMIYNSQKAEIAQRNG